MEQLLSLCQELVSAGQALQAAAEAEDAGARLRAMKAVSLEASHVAAARRVAGSNSGATLWDQLAALAVPLSDVSRALAGVMSLASQQQALLAAAIYTHLLTTAGCPVFSLFDRGICSTLLKLLREAAAGKGGGSKKGRAGGDGEADGEAMDVDMDPSEGTAAVAAEESDEDFEGAGPSQRGGSRRASQKTGSAGGGSSGALVAEAFANLAALLAGFGLRDQPDTVRSLAEAAAEGSRAAGGAGPAEACYTLLGNLLQPIHGSVREVAAMVFRLLTNNILGLGGGGKAAGGTARTAAAVRARAIQFAKDSLRRSPECREAVAALARHVVLRAPDKADFRAAAVEGAVALALALDPAEQQQLVAFVARLSRTPKVSQRQMAVELAPALLEAFDDPFQPVDLHQPLQAAAAGAAGASGKTPGSQQTLVVDGQELMAAPWGAVCLAVLVQRCADKSAAVRGRAMQNLAGVVAAWASFNGGNSREEVRFCAALGLAHEVKLQPQPIMGAEPDIISPGIVSPAHTDEPGGTPMTVADGITPHPARREPGAAGAATAGRRTHASTRSYSCFTMPCAALEGGEADLRSLLHSARKRCSDEKGQVRKAAVQLLEALLIMRAAGVQRTLPQAKDVAAIEAATGDALVSVRKAGLVAAYSLLKALPDQPAVAGLWVRAALPLIRDVEASVQEALLDQFQDLVTGRAVAASAVSREGGATSSAQKAAEELRPVLAAFAAGGGACKACVARACSQLKAKSRLKTRQAAAGLQQIILGLGPPAADAAADADAVAGAWLLFAEVSAQDPGAPSWRFLEEQWDAVTHQGAAAAEGEAAAAGSNDNAAQLLRVIAAAAAEFPADRARQLAEQLLRALRGFTLSPAAAAAHVAAVAQLTARHGAGAGTTGWAPELLSSAEKVLGEYVEQYQAGRPEASMQGADWRAAGALFTAGEVALLRLCKPSGRLVVLVQALTSPRLALAPAQLGSQAGSGALGDEAPAGAAEVPGTVQAHAWVALGKLCLTDEALAKKCVPLFVQELGRAAAPAVRNNIMVALADLVINYTALVDSHVPRLAACIRDPNELVRTQALALLANLLQKDYVKWRGPLFHRFLLALTDDSPRVRQLAEYLLGDTIATKLPNLAYNHFVEALFVLNDCQVGLAGGAAAAAALSAETSGAELGGGVADRDAFCLKGASPRVRGQRDAIYRALLSRMTPEHKFATAARLCQEVLGGAADGALPLEECQEVLGDALRILACKEIKVTASKAAAEDLESDPAAAVGAAKGKLVSAMMKKHLVEGVVPVIIELKRGMEAARHPLLGDLMAATAAMLKDYKNEIEDILVADRLLAKEILYDMRQAELAKAAAKAAPAPAAASGGADAGPAGTPVSAGRPRQGSLPAGTTTGTPMAAEVLLTARKAAAGAGNGASTPSGALSARTPGGGLLPRKTPGSGFKTPGVPPTAAKTHSTGVRTTSRLARASGPAPTPLPGAAAAEAAAPGTGARGGSAPLSVPRLRTASHTPGGTRAASRLRPTEQEALAQQAAQLAMADRAGGAAAEEGEERVLLPFAAPAAPGAATPPAQQWNVTAEAAQLAGQVGEDGGTDIKMEPAAEGPAESEQGAAPGATRGRDGRRPRRTQGGGAAAAKPASSENAAVNSAQAQAAGGGGAAVKEEPAAAGRARPTRKRKA